MRIGKFVALVRLARDNDNLLGAELELGAGRAQAVDGALCTFRVGVETVQGFHSATSVGSGPSSTRS